MGKKQAYFVIDVALCFDCNDCFMACKDEHVGNTWLPYTREQPRHGHKWVDIRMKERGQYPRIDVAYLPVMCQQCENAACEKAFPEAVRRLENGIVQIDPEKARDKQAVMESCPYRAVYWNEEFCSPQKCTMCAHILESGQEPGIPRCAHSCPTEAIRYYYLEPEEMAQKIIAEDLEELSPELHSRPHVFYKNLYRYRDAFISGEVLKDGDCAEGVSITLKGYDRDGNAVEAEAVTDCFGEFKFDRLRRGRYFVAARENILWEGTLGESLNIGEFSLDEGKFQ